MGSHRVQRLLQLVLLANMAFALVLGPVTLFVSDWWWRYLGQRAADVGVVLLALLTAELADAFVGRTSRRWPRYVTSSLLLVMALVLDAVPFKVPELIVPWLGVSVGRIEFTTALFLAAWTSAVAPAWRTALTAVRHTAGAKHQNRIRYLVACLVGLALSDLFVLVARLPEVYVGLAARLLALSIVTFALLHYHLPDLRRLILSTERIIVLTAITATVYVAFLAVALFFFTASLNVYTTILFLPPLAGAVVLAAVLDVILGPRLRERFERTVLGHHYDPQKALRAYSQQVSVLLDLDRVAEVTLGWLSNTLRVQRGAFVVLKQHDRGVELAAVRTIDGSGSPQAAVAGDMTFDRDSRFLVHFTRQRRPLSQYDVDMLGWFQAMPGRERGWLKALGADLYVPVLLDQDLVALL
ncbi:MAG TPA: hypothetical protein VLC95_08365, partial [Anaerolineae bacterium]|nr:hypothetical protein [Anaerolineae bacterium]